jgi:hypothetical protein
MVFLHPDEFVLDIGYGARYIRIEFERGGMHAVELLEGIDLSGLWMAVLRVSSKALFSGWATKAL